MVTAMVAYRHTIPAMHTTHAGAPAPGMHDASGDAAYPYFINTMGLVSEYAPVERR